MLPSYGPLSRRDVLKGAAATAIGLATVADLSGFVSQSVAADAPSPFSFQIADGVSDDDRAAIQDGLQLGADFFQATFGGGVIGAVQVQVFAADTLPGQWSAQSDLTRIQVRTIQAGWTQKQMLGQQGTRTLHMGTMTHEYFHTLQDQWAGIAHGTPTGPNWLVEGTAEYIGYKALDWKGLLPYDAVRAQLVKDIAGKPPPALDTLEAQDAFIAATNGTPVYGLGVLATDMLVATPGIAALQTYFAALPGQEWHDAFTAAFGTDVGSFYQQFAQSRQNGFI